MPKVKFDKKGEVSKMKGKARSGPGGFPSNEDSVNGDSASMAGINSECGSYKNDNYVNGNVDQEEEGICLFGAGSRQAMEEKVAEAIDGIIEKSASVRTSSLCTLVNVFTQNFNPGLILSRRETLRDRLEKILKKGQSSEQALAGTIHSLAILQIGACDPELASQDFLVLKPFLQSLMMDHTTDSNVRVKCCVALCFGTFVNSDKDCSMEVVKETISILEPLIGFGAGGTGKITKSSSSTLAAAAMSGWSSLLLTLMSDEYLDSKVWRWIAQLRDLLEQPDLAVRLNAGEGIV